MPESRPAPKSIKSKEQMGRSTFTILKHTGTNQLAAECNFVSVPASSNTFEEQLVSFTQNEIEDQPQIRSRFDWAVAYGPYTDWPTFEAQALALAFTQNVLDAALAEPRGPIG